MKCDCPGRRMGKMDAWREWGMAWMGHGVEMISIGAFALAFLVVIPAGNLLLPVVRGQQSAVSHTTAFAFVLALAFLVVIPEGNLLFAFAAISSQSHPRPKERHRANARLLHAMLLPGAFKPARSHPPLRRRPHHLRQTRERSTDTARPQTSGPAKKSAPTSAQC